MEYYDKNKESPYLNYWDISNLYGWTMSQKLPVNSFEWIEDTPQFNENFIKSYNEKSDEGYFLKVDVQYSEKIYELHNDLPLLSKRKKLKTFETIVTNLHDKNEYVIQIRNLKQVLINGLILKKVHKRIKFNQNAWLKPYIDMNTDLRKKEKIDFEKDFFKLLNNSVF